MTIPDLYHMFDTYLRYYRDAIKEPPYNFYCTTAGVRCINKLEVLDADCKVIPGLYAAGNTVGYRYGSMYQTIIPGGTNAFATTHGYVAGESAAKA